MLLSSWYYSLLNISAKVLKNKSRETLFLKKGLAAGQQSAYCVFLQTWSIQQNIIKYHTQVSWNRWPRYVVHTDLLKTICFTSVINNCSLHLLKVNFGCDTEASSSTRYGGIFTAINDCHDFLYPTMMTVYFLLFPMITRSNNSSLNDNSVMPQNH